VTGLTHLTEARNRAYILADNGLAEQARWGGRTQSAATAWAGMSRNMLQGVSIQCLKFAL
jgi:hypothetical protein